jgi:hypothetical protein
MTRRAAQRSQDRMIQLARVIISHVRMKSFATSEGKKNGCLFTNHLHAKNT